jgi:hypothetical protein
MDNAKIQKILISHGLLDPPADGVWGAQSRAALEDFQSMHQLPVTGKVDDTTRSTLEKIPVPEIKLGTDLASKIIRFMLKQNYFISRSLRRYNIVYIEGASADGTPNSDTFNEWNDRRILIEISNDIPKIVGNWLATTEPGATYTFQPMNPGGAFRIAFGQYRAWTFGLHGRTQYPALVQCAPVSGYRDQNMDGIRTGDPFVTGDYFGINQHHGWNMQLIGEASAGCLVGQSIEAHQEFMQILRGDRRIQVNPSYVFYTTIIPADKL